VTAAVQQSQLFLRTVSRGTQVLVQ